MKNQSRMRSWGTATHFLNGTCSFFTSHMHAPTQRHIYSSRGPHKLSMRLCPSLLCHDCLCSCHQTCGRHQPAPPRLTLSTSCTLGPPRPPYGVRHPASSICHLISHLAPTRQSERPGACPLLCSQSLLTVDVAHCQEVLSLCAAPGVEHALDHPQTSSVLAYVTLPLVSGSLHTHFQCM